MANNNTVTTNNNIKALQYSNQQLHVCVSSYLEANHTTSKVGVSGVCWVVFQNHFLLLKIYYLVLCIIPLDTTNHCMHISQLILFSILMLV